MAADCDRRIALFHAEWKLREVDETIDAWLELDEETEIGRADDRSGERRANRMPIGHVGPGIRLLIFHRERDALSVVLDFDHLDAHLLADGNEFLRIADATATHLRHMQQAIDAAEVDEGAEGREGFDSAGELSSRHDRFA